jgi:hypothetical protein
MFLSLNSHAACPAAVTANTYTNEAVFLEGPVPSGGGSVNSLEATNNATAAGVWVIDVIDNTASTGGGANGVLLSCTITSLGAGGPFFCQNTGSVSVPAGHYLEVRVTTTSGGNKQFRVTFRY